MKARLTHLGLALTLLGAEPAIAQEASNTQITGFASVPWGSGRAAVEAEHGAATSVAASGDTLNLVFHPHELLGAPAGVMTFTLVNDSLVSGKYLIEQQEEYCLHSFRAATAAIQRANPEVVAEPESVTAFHRSTIRERQSVQCGWWLASLGGSLVGSQTFRDPDGSAKITVLWVGREQRQVQLIITYHATDPVDAQVRKAF